jgi:hypothetical protein
MLFSGRFAIQSCGRAAAVQSPVFVMIAGDVETVIRLALMSNRLKRSGGILRRRAGK